MDLVLMLDNRGSSNTIPCQVKFLHKACREWEWVVIVLRVPPWPWPWRLLDSFHLIKVAQHLQEKCLITVKLSSQKLPT